MYGLHSVKYAGSGMWNKLDLYFRSADSAQQFKGFLNGMENTKGMNAMLLTVCICCNVRGHGIFSFHIHCIVGLDINIHFVDSHSSSYTGQLIDSKKNATLTLDRYIYSVHVSIKFNLVGEHSTGPVYFHLSLEILSKLIQLPRMVRTVLRGERVGKKTFPTAHPSLSVASPPLCELDINCVRYAQIALSLCRRVSVR